MKKIRNYRLIKNVQIQGVQTLRNEAYIEVRRNDEGCSTIPRNAGLMGIFHQPGKEKG
jgi:hypothetical protein